MIGDLARARSQWKRAGNANLVAMIATTALTMTTMTMTKDGDNDY
jgi:hypothetical protein